MIAVKIVIGVSGFVLMTACGVPEINAESYADMYLLDLNRVLKVQSQNEE